MTIAEELEQIRQAAGGIIKPEDVVAYAENPSTSLHSRFTWDDTVAAREYRLWQARELIRVQVKVIPALSEPIRAYVSLEPDRACPGGGYRALDDVMANEEFRRQLLEQAERDMERFTAKYAQLQELAEVVAAMKKVRRPRAA